MLGLVFGVWSVTGAGLLDSAGIEGRSSGFWGSTSFREGLAGGGALLNFLLRFCHVDLNEAGDINEVVYWKCQKSVMGMKFLRYCTSPDICDMLIGVEALT